MAFDQKWSSRPSRLATGAVLATAGLLGTYMAAIRPQPTYASASRGGQGTSAPQRPGAAALSPRVAPACDTTATDDTTLRTAILSSRDDSVICIDGHITLSSSLPTLDDTTVTLVGDDSSLDVIDGQDYWGMIAADFTGPDDDTLSIMGLTLEDGVGHPRNLSTYGGGIHVSGTSPQTGNDALIVTESTLASNSADLGGAIHLQDASGSIAHSTFQGNYSGTSGGAVFVSHVVPLEVYASSFTGNMTNSAGGAMTSFHSDVTLTNSFSGGNYAVYGGFMYGYASDLTLEFSTLYDDSTVFSYFPQEVASYSGNLTAIGSVIGHATRDVVVDGSNLVIDDTFSVSTGTTSIFTGSGSQSIPAGSLQLGAVNGSGPGQQGRAPAPASVLVTGAPSTDLGTGVSTDQLGHGRPSPGQSLWTIGARQVASASTPPTPTFPPSAPRDVTARPGDGEATVSWAPPTNPGSFPVSHYRVSAEPGGASCLVAVPATSCTVTGLTNGRSYTFTVEALNGAGWGPVGGPSAPVTPRQTARNLVLDQGTRVDDGRHDRIRTTGSSSGIPEGSKLTPHFRYTGQASFTEGKATITVRSDGTFTWTRHINKDRGLTAYVSWQDLKSNKVFWARVR